MGDCKYLLYLSLVGRLLYGLIREDRGRYDLYFHVLLLAVLRHFFGQLGISLSRWPYLSSRYQIQKKGFSFDAVDLSSNWDDYIILDTLLLSVTVMIPMFGNRYYPPWDWTGLVICALLHMGPAEAIYYWLHRALHGHYLYTRYHSHHHSLFVTEANSGTVHPFLEHLMYASNFAIPLFGTWALGRFSISTLYVYTLTFDTLNAIGHCNVEFVPSWLFDAFPPLKYLIYTPSYHSLHHSQVHTNFCLFMPIYDYWGGTMDKNSDALYRSVRRSDSQERADNVYLTHGMDLLHMMHVTLGIQSFAATPYKGPNWRLWLLYPLALIAMPLLWILGQPFAADKYWIPRTLRGETWLIPRYRFHYSLPVEKVRINALIEQAIVMAEDEGCRVVSLGQLNKEMRLNGSGAAIVVRNPHLKVRIVTGLTLTAAVVINRLPKQTKEVFLVGSSDLIRSVEIYLVRRGVRVLVLTNSPRYFGSTQPKVTKVNQQLIVNVMSFQEGQHCREWILDEYVEGKDLKWAPPGADLHHVCQGSKPLPRTRKDCTYAMYPAMHVPKSMKGLRSCEGGLPRGVISASHAAGVVHSLEKWTHNEVGPIDVERIDTVWAAALKHGFQMAV